MEHSHTTGPDSYGTVGEGDGGKGPRWRGSTPVGSSDPAMTPGYGAVEAGFAQCVDEEVGAREWKNA